MITDFDSLTQKKLQELALTNGNTFVRYCAVEKLTDQETLKFIALKRREDTAVRKKAVERLTDQEALKYLALLDEHWEIRNIAVERLTDQETLKFIAFYDEHWMVREIAQSNFNSIIRRKSDN